MQIGCNLVDLLLSLNIDSWGSNPPKEDSFMVRIEKAVKFVFTSWVFRAALLLLGTGIAFPQPNGY